MRLVPRMPTVGQFVAVYQLPDPPDPALPLWSLTLRWRDGELYEVNTVRCVAKEHASQIHGKYWFEKYNPIYYAAS